MWTAPRDGRDVILRLEIDKEIVETVAFWDEVKQLWATVDDAYFKDEWATGWKPYPATMDVEGR